MSHLFRVPVFCHRIIKCCVYHCCADFFVLQYSKKINLNFSVHGGRYRYVYILYTKCYVNSKFVADSELGLALASSLLLVSKVVLKSHTTPMKQNIWIEFVPDAMKNRPYIVKSCMFCIELIITIVITVRTKKE